MVVARKNPKDPGTRVKLRDIADAARLFDITTSDGWSELKELSSDTSIDGVYVDPESVILNVDGSFEGSANVYVNLDYGPDEDLRTTEAFIGRFKGHVTAGQAPTIQRFDVDTSPFLEAVSTGDANAD